MPPGNENWVKRRFMPSSSGRDVRVDLAVSPLEIGVRHQAGPAVAGAGDVDHVEVVLLDHAVEVDVDEVQTGCGAPVAQEPRLDVLLGERLLEQRVVVEIDLADRQVVGGAPVGVDQRLFLARKPVLQGRLLFPAYHRLVIPLAVRPRVAGAGRHTCPSTTQSHPSHRQHRTPFPPDTPRADMSRSRSDDNAANLSLGKRTVTRRLWHKSLGHLVSTHGGIAVGM